MAIHHDKPAYGKLAPLGEAFSEERIMDMVSELSDEDKMSEYDKMLSGKLYIPADKELTELRKRARDLVYEYNATRDEEEEKRKDIVHKLLGGHGDYFYFEPPFHFDYGKNTYIGDDVFANFNLTILDCAPVRIGKQVFMGPNVTIATPVHPLLACDRNIRTAKDGSKYDYEYAKPVTIEDNVWIASAVTINGGVRIGHDSVIGSGSVVTRDIPSGVFAAGTPCRVIRKLTAADKMKLPNE